jgi:hypothetical protein
MASESIRLFVIESTWPADRPSYWARSSEHGTGWHEGWPKQAFSPSELATEIRWMIDHEIHGDFRTRELTFWQDCQEAARARRKEARDA